MSDFEMPSIYWLNGLAGTGKSAIAQTIAERAHRDGKLGASFFCSQYSPDLCNPELIFPTLAVQLARRYTDFRSIFISSVRSDPQLAYTPPDIQMQTLIVRPLVECQISTVIVIDALDECKDNLEYISTILSALDKFVSQIPKVKIFITGRPEPQIQRGFRKLQFEQFVMFVLHDVKLCQVDTDIRLFLTHRLAKIGGRLDGWPTVEHLDLLCRRAAGLFVYAAATVGYIGRNFCSPKKELDRILQSPESSAFEGRTKIAANLTLDSLYMSVLRNAFGGDDPEDDPTIRSVLGAAILAETPLSPSGIAKTLDLDVDHVLVILASVHSLLVLQDDDPVRPFHKSFPHFIVDPDRCTDSRWRLSSIPNAAKKDVHGR